MGSRIWFEKAPAARLGALYVGYANNFPQGGMNEAGLAFDGLTVYPKNSTTRNTKKTIPDAVLFLKEIMQTCKTVEDVEHYATQFNRQVFSGGVMLFADKFGHYLIMESDTMMIGKEDKYIIANFCPSITPDTEKLNWARYNRGSQFIQNHTGDTTNNYCLALVDTMHECREKIGDGTIYSFVADLEKGDFSVYFYHDYQHKITFNVTRETTKGNHVFEIPALFPKNKEYQQLQQYKTPQNSTGLLLWLYGCGALFLFSTFFFVVGFLRKMNALQLKNAGDNRIRILYVGLGLLLTWHIFVLVKNQPVFYFPAPYVDNTISLISIASYIPFLLLLIIMPLFWINIKSFKKGEWQMFSSLLLLLNNLAYISLIFLFIYWDLYDVL